MKMVDGLMSGEDLDGDRLLQMRIQTNGAWKRILMNRV